MNTILKIISLCISIFAIGSEKGFSTPSDLLFVLIILISIHNIFDKENLSFSLNKMFHLFCLFFFGIAPPIQFNNKLTFWGSLQYGEFYYTVAGGLLLFSIIIYNIFYHRYFFIIQKKINSVSLIDYSQNKLKISSLRKLLLLIISITCFFIEFQSKGFNIIQLLVRDFVDVTGSSTESSSSSTVWLLTEYFIRPTNLIIFIMLQYFAPNEKIKWWFLFIGVLTMSPIATARFATAAIYLPILFVSTRMIWKKNFFSVFFISAFLVIWPLMNVFRRFGESEMGDFTLSFDLFKQVDMDAFQNFANVIKYDLVTFGHQLLGNIFFWVPRSLWDTKPTGSAFFLADKCKYDFSNVSCCYFAEGYINFGVLGTLLFAAFLAIISARFDVLFWQNNGRRKSVFFNILFSIDRFFVFYFTR